jgi:5'-nucleotidase
MTSDSKIILIDMDDVLADYERGFLQIWKERHPQEFYVSIEQRTIFSMEKQYPARLNGKIREIIDGPGFYRSLPQIKGGIEAVLEMSKNHEVFICTAPRIGSSSCIPEKYEWIKSSPLGADWLKRLIITWDKTLVKGDFLIDDNPNPSGAMLPTWEHVIFDFPYNRHIAGKRRINWDNWKEVLKL